MEDALVLWISLTVLIFSPLHLSPLTSSSYHLFTSRQPGISALCWPFIERGHLSRPGPGCWIPAILTITFALTRAPIIVLNFLVPKGHSLTYESYLTTRPSHFYPVKHAQTVREYQIHTSEVHDVVVEASNRRKYLEAAEYNKRICRVVHHLGDLVMLYQKDTGKLEPRWRGPFRITNYGGSHNLSFKLQQLNGRWIRGTFHGDHLKTFIPRTGYLTDPSDTPLPVQQTIRKPAKRARLHLRPPKPPQEPPPGTRSHPHETSPPTESLTTADHTLGMLCNGIPVVASR
ncbi:hypothetical protein BDR22DRAFT_889337 [Usnea florida]